MCTWSDRQVYWDGNILEILAITMRTWDLLKDGIFSRKYTQRILNRSKKDFIECLTDNDTGLEICESRRLESCQFQRVWALVSARRELRCNAIAGGLAPSVQDGALLRKAGSRQRFHGSFVIVPWGLQTQVQIDEMRGQLK